MYHIKLVDHFLDLLTEGLVIFFICTVKEANQALVEIEKSSRQLTPRNWCTFFSQPLAENEIIIRGVHSHPR